MPKRGKSKNKAQQFCLVRWLEDETVSVVLASSVADSIQNPCVGTIQKFKWTGGKSFDVEVLKLLVRFEYMYILLCWLIGKHVRTLPRQEQPGSKPKIILRYDFSSSFVPGDRPALLKDCNKLVNMETTQEDIMAETECEVDSTTEESPLKNPNLRN